LRTELETNAMIHRWEDVKRKRLGAAQIAEVEAAAERDVLELDLRALREAAQMTQAQMAPLIEMSQSELSRLERRSDLRLSTLARYVRAIGGHVKIVAEVGKKKITLAEG
jgi:DNA-binding XRE family transcriptional regulator